MHIFGIIILKSNILINIAKSEECSLEIYTNVQPLNADLNAEIIVDEHSKGNIDYYTAERLLLNRINSNVLRIKHGLTDEWLALERFYHNRFLFELGLQAVASIPSKDASIQGIKDNLYIKYDRILLNKGKELYRKEAEDMVESTPNYWGVYANMGNLELHLNQNVIAATSCYRRALTLYPKNPLVLAKINLIKSKML